jgi:DNA replication and repair protein RecF
MQIKKISLLNFRNHSQLELVFEKQLTVIVGDNGVGKTNILEAIYYLSIGKSFRLNEFTKLINYASEYSKIDALIERKSVRHHLKVVIQNPYQRFFVNQVLKSRISDYIGSFNAVLFAPSDGYLLTQPPKHRRRLLDTELGKLSKTYLEYLGEYNNLLKERNATLKLHQPDVALLDVIDDRMVVLMIEIARQRGEFLLKLLSCAKRYFNVLVPEIKDFSIVYNSIEYSKGLVEIRNKINEGIAKDLLLKQTSYGIHRDDFIIKVDDTPIVEIFSQGQVRLLVLALKLALCDVIEEVIKERPVLLLDDVLSELDVGRQQYLLNLVERQQTIITTTHLDQQLKIADLQLVKLT